LVFISIIISGYQQHDLNILGSYIRVCLAHKHFNTSSIKIKKEKNDKLYAIKSKGIIENLWENIGDR
jgi:hypothetical protein